MQIHDMRCSKVARLQPRATRTPGRLGKDRLSHAQLLNLPIVLGGCREAMGDRSTSSATALRPRRPLADVNDAMERSRLAWSRRRSYSPRKTMQPPTDRVASTEAFSLRFDRIPVNTGGSHGPRALRRILLAAPHGSEQRPCIPSYISTAAAAHDIRRHRTSCLQVRHSPQPSERAPRTMSDSEARWTCHVPVVLACISPFMRSSRTVESLSCFR